MSGRQYYRPLRVAPASAEDLRQVMPEMAHVAGHDVLKRGRFAVAAPRRHVEICASRGAAGWLSGVPSITRAICRLNNRQSDRSS